VLDADFAVFNIDQLVTVAPGCHPSARGELGVISHAAIAARDSRIVWVGTVDELHEAVKLRPDATVLNTHGRTVLPGFVDAHTHPVFAGDRSGDFYARALGQSYGEQVAAGGLMQTVRATREADEDTLLTLAFERCGRFLAYGTTTIEAKTGYGLTLRDELKSLRVLTRLQRLQPVKVVPTFLGAHVVPTDFAGSPDDYVSEIAENWLPSIQGQAVAVDAWSDEGAFTADQCRRVLDRARDLGFTLTMHANELGPGPGVRVAAALGARSVDHAVYLDDDDIEALSHAGTVAVLLPSTTFFLGSHRYAPARRLIDGGVTVALGTDFNPGTSHTQNMQFVLTLAVLKLQLTPEEAVRAATIGAARAIGMQDSVGSVEPGKFCDATVFRVDDYRQIPYYCAMNLVESVVAAGRVVVSGSLAA
jgi:imidazolonepropionase